MVNTFSVSAFETGRASKHFDSLQRLGNCAVPRKVFISPMVCQYEHSALSLYPGLPSSISGSSELEIVGNLALLLPQHHEGLEKQLQEIA